MRGALAIAAGLLLAACGDVEHAGTSERLAAAYALEAGPSPAWTVRLEDSRGPVGLVQELPRGDFIGVGVPGIQAIELVLTGRGGAPASAVERARAQAGGQRVPVRQSAEAEGAAHRLLEGEVELTYVALPDRLDVDTLGPVWDDFPVGGFTLLGTNLVVRPHGTDEPLTYTATVDPQLDHDGVPHVELGGSSFQGFGVPTGSRARLGDLSWETGASLRLGLAGRGGRGGLTGSLTLVLRLDGDEIARVEDLDLTAEPTATWRSLPLQGTGGELALEVEGDPGELLVLAPSLTRPRASSQRPDLLLFLADTFRADNLAHAGADPALTPHINAFAEGAVTFDHAWSTASWTLPSQASLLTGLMPHRHGAVFEQLALDGRHETLPELLGRAGYRTVAVTEGGFVVPSFGLAQGFEEFVVGPSNDLDATLANLREVLARDDGRPLFLYLQTFRAHSDYVATDAARAALAELFATPPATGAWDFQQLVTRIATDVGDADFLAPQGTNAVLADEALAHPALADLERLYRGGSWDVDAGFGAFLGILEEHGLADAPLVFTSDHGEAFGEHGIVGHGNSAFEEELRIPLVVRLPGAAPRTTTAPASILDLGPTLCELADIAVPAHWEGRSLVPELRGAAPAERPLLAFECPSRPTGLPAEFALLQGRRKIVGLLTDAGIDRASVVGYDLAADPQEASPEALEGGPGWIAALADEAQRLVERYGEARFPAQEIALTPEAEAELRAMGYLGGEAPGTPGD